MEEQRNDLIFALDIGTRSIIGIVGHQQGEHFHVEAFEQVQHPKRAMIDGQIEDITQVARVAEEVKTRLEEKLQTRLRRVAVAAAGRALKTCTASCKMPLPASTTANSQFVYELENSAVNQARGQLDQDGDPTQYYCVGHSVVRYLVDGYPFTTLLDHGGKEAEVEIIATFLPTEVVTSLRRCMEIIGLDIDVLTLEPIAAMRAVLPRDVRLLNLAMVDIGAGTADIALTRDGAVSGYTMATVAGDEITEAIIRKCLVDFDTAEVIKLALEAEETVQYKDILGHEQSMATADILAAIDVSVEMLAKVISDRIEECNGGPPMAVFLVGGGSRTPSLCGKVAEKLALPQDKVALAGTNFSQRVLDGETGMDSPEYATPVGIALSAADEEKSGRACIDVNGRRIRLYTSEQPSVMDALLMAGYSYSDLMGRNGRSVTFTLNGERKVARGGQYTVAEITLNGKPASLTSPTENGDCIEIVPATCGEDAAPRITHYANGAVPLAVTLNGSGVKAGLLAFLNGQPVLPDAPIGELDEVEISVVDTVGQLCRSYGIPADTPGITRNKQPAQPDTKLEHGDAISAPVGGTQQTAVTAAPEAPAAEEPVSVVTETPAIPQAPAEAPAVAEAEHLTTTAEASGLVPSLSPTTGAENTVPPAPEALAAEEPVSVITETPAIPQAPAEAPAAAQEPPSLSNLPPAEPFATPSEPSAPIETAPPPLTPPEFSQPASLPGSSLKIELNGRTVVLPPKAGGSPHFLLDMLPLVDIDPSNPKGKVLIRRNGTDAAYLEELVTGDQVEIRWENET